MRNYRPMIRPNKCIEVEMNGQKQIRTLKQEVYVEARGNSLIVNIDLI